jgi:hypothetical protein
VRGNDRAAPGRMETVMPAHKNPTPLSPEDRATYDSMIHPRPAGRTQLAEEVFAIAFGAAEDWPRAKRHLDAAKRYVLASLHGARKRPAVPVIDLWFAAEMIARSLEADLGMTEPEVVALFDAIGLPVDAVPRYGTPALRTPLADSLAKLATNYATSFALALCPRLRTKPHDCWACDAEEEQELDLDDERSAA